MEAVGGGIADRTTGMRGAAAAGAEPWLPEGAEALRIRSFMPSSSSSNSVISFSSRICRISFSSLRSNPAPPRWSWLTGKTHYSARPRGVSRKRDLGSGELALELESGRPQRVAGAADEGPRGEGGEQEVFGRDGDEQGDHPLGDDRELLELAEAGVGGGGEAGPQQRRVLGGHRVQVRVRAQDQLVDRDAVRAHYHEDLRLRDARGDGLEGLRETGHAFIPS